MVSEPLAQALAPALAAALGVGVRSLRAVAGGDINDAYRAELADGTRVFVKTSANAPPGMYEAERRGLEWLAAAGALRIPRCLAVVDAGEAVRCLVLEWIEPARRARDFEERLGRGLAALHGAGAAGFGWDGDNFIGTLPQGNAPRPTWAEFYGEQRLRPQLERAIASGRVGAELGARFEGLLARIDVAVGMEEQPARLHGDLWSGNVHVDELGQPCLIDPAVYGGQREVDLAMLQLFGSPSERFFAAYGEVWPLQAGWRERVPLYQLYPLLVHVNLFGGTYAAQLAAALERAERIAAG